MDFQQEAVVSSGITLGTNDVNMQLNMGTNSLAVKSGTLTLTSNVSVSGSGEKVISMEGGRLVLGTNGSTGSTEMRLENTGSGYVIGAAEEEKTKAGIVECNHQGIVMLSKNGAGNVIEDMKLVADQTAVQLPAYVTVNNGLLEWRKDSSTLAYVPAEFTATGLTVSAARMNLALQAHETVTVGEDAQLMVNKDEAVTVPAGKTLCIQSKIKQLGQSQYSGGSLLYPGAKMILDSEASLVIEGVLWSSGTVQVGNNGKGAKLVVNSGGTVQVDEIQLESGSLIINNGIIDGGKITSAGGATIENNSLIKLKDAYVYTGTATGNDTYNGSADSALISNNASTAMPKGADQSGSELAHIASVTGGNDPVEYAPVQYYYADVLNEWVAYYINNLYMEKTDAAYVCQFAKNALVSQGTKIELKNFNASMGTNELQLAGDLILTDTRTIEGIGDAVIRVKDSGTLTFDRTSGSTSDGAFIRNTSEETGKYAIAGAWDNTTTKKFITWNDDKLYILSEKTPAYSVQGVGITDDGVSTGKDIFNLKEGYTLVPKEGLCIEKPER